ncbi:MAG: ANTAR domain-containing response regulator [Myxococcota bacterium]
MAPFLLNQGQAKIILTARKRESGDLRVLLIDSNDARAAGLQRALELDGCEVISLRNLTEPEQIVAEHAPEVILIEQDSPTRDTLESMRRITEVNPRPIAFFVDRSDRESMRKALRAGVSAYVVHELDTTRVRTILEVAVARFESHQAELQERDQLSMQLGKTQERLRERRDIERAKGLLMKRLGLGEEEAFSRMRQEAMDQNLSLGKIAERVLTNLGRSA